MAGVIWAVNIDTVPACREGNRGPNTTGTSPSREALRVGSGARGTAGNPSNAGIDRSRIAPMAKLALHALGCLQRGITYKHAEALLESRHVRFTVIRRDVVYRDAPHRPQPDVGELWHTLVCAVSGSEIHHCGPVIREIFGECTACAR